MEKIILRWSIDDGRKNCVRAADLLKRYGFKGIFYIAPYEKKCNMTIREIMDIAKHHEIGGHTLFHTILTKTDPETARKEICDSKKEFEEMLGKKIKKFATPRGYYTPEIIQMIKEAGYIEHRGTKMGIVDIKDYDVFHLPCSAHFYPRPEYEEKGILKSIIDKFDEALTTGNYFNVLIHTDELDRFNLWEDFETVVKYIWNKRDEVKN